MFDCFSKVLSIFFEKPSDRLSNSLVFKLLNVTEFNYFDHSLELMSLESSFGLVGLSLTVSASFYKDPS